jgi:hypothetical protein
MQWWAVGVVVYMLIGVLISKDIRQPSSILISLLWALFWPLLLLLVKAIDIVWPETPPRT